MIFLGMWLIKKSSARHIVYDKKARISSFAVRVSARKMLIFIVQ